MPAADPQVQTFREDLELIEHAARGAAAIALRYFRAGPQVWLKSGSSPVSEADFAVDRYLHDLLTSSRPGYGWLSEESVRKSEAEGHGRTFIVDPIDGTRAFIEGKDVWCVSIAVVENGVPLAGVLHAPARGEVFTALRGGGSAVDGKSIGRQRETQANPVVAGPKAMMSRLPGAIRESIRPAEYIPSLAYRVALVAKGELDATFIKANAHDWDLAAADLILGESGGVILDEGSKTPYYAGDDPRLGPLAAGSGNLVRQMAESLRG